MAPATGTRRHNGHNGHDGCSQWATENCKLQGLHEKQWLDIIHGFDMFSYDFILYSIHIYSCIMFSDFAFYLWVNYLLGSPMIWVNNVQSLGQCAGSLEFDGVWGLALRFYHAQKSAASVLHKAILQLRLVQAQNLFITSCCEKWTSAIWFRILATASRTENSWKFHLYTIYMAEEVLRVRAHRKKVSRTMLMHTFDVFSAADLQRSQEFLVQIDLRHIIECWSWILPKSSKY